jgi:hypothetical protein
MLHTGTDPLTDMQHQHQPMITAYREPDRIK